MTWINYSIFTEKWLGRAERKKKFVDDVDRFISLWIAFNGWMKGKYGENKREREMVDRIKELKDMEKVFSALQKDNPHFSADLSKLREYTVADMRYINDENRIREYDGTFESLIEVIYRVRCNLFHGRKGTEEDKKDFELICLSYRILLPLFRKYLRCGYS